MTPLSLADVLLEESHPMVLAKAAQAKPHDKPEKVLISNAKRQKRKEAAERGEEYDISQEVPEWHAEHAEEWRRKLGIDWVHPSKNAKLLEWRLRKPTLATLPWREIDLVYFMHLAYPHSGDTQEDSVEAFDEMTLEVSQEIHRCQWHTGNFQCLTNNSVIILRFRGRLVLGVEKLRCHGLFSPDESKSWGSVDDTKQTELAGLSYNGFMIAALTLALAVHMPEHNLQRVLANAP